MCIDDSRHRSAGIRLLEAAATGMVWLAYFGILPYLWAAFMQLGTQAPAVSVPFQWTGVGANGLGFDSFLAQLFTVVLCGSSLLYTWARYNGVRFRGKDRRKTAVTVTAPDLAVYYGGTPDQIVTLQDARRLYMRHDANGRLTRIHYGEAPDPRNSATRSDRRVRASSGDVQVVSETPIRFDAMSTQELRRYTRKRA
jgi:biofilm PGA synthesis protein PgaD